MEIVGVPRPTMRGQASMLGHNSDDLDQRRRQLLKGFSQKMKLLLTESDQDYLLAALKVGMVLYEIYIMLFSTDMGWGQFQFHFVNSNSALNLSIPIPFIYLLLFTIHE